MDLEAIRAALHTALPLRPPRWADDPGISGRVKVEKLEDYMLEAAWHHAELEEALHWLNAAHARFADEIEQLTGYETMLPRKPRDRLTQADTLAAKRMVAPATFSASKEVVQIRESVLRQIARFEFEKDTMSRAYSLIAGRS